MMRNCSDPATWDLRLIRTLPLVADAVRFGGVVGKVANMVATVPCNQSPTLTPSLVAQIHRVFRDCSI